MAETYDDDVFDLDADFQAVRKRPFKFLWGGQQFELPHFSEIDWRAAGLVEDIEAMAGADNIAQVDLAVLRQMFDYAFDPAQRVRWNEQWQPGPAIGRLFERWQQHSGADLGESSGSAGSSASTAGPSKRTSTGTTGSGSSGRSTGRRKSG